MSGTAPVYTSSRGIKAGAVGGIVGSLIQGLIGFALTQSMGEEIFFVTVAKLMGLGSASFVGGWGLHIITGLIVGAIFMSITARVGTFRLAGVGKSVGVGVVAGIVVWVVWFVPLISVLIPGSLSRGDLLIGALILHIVYGTITAVIARMFLRRGTQL
ncbi:MAG: hypothetical protein HYY67_08515 [Thaumarchaeota archaeon]|nr:hypothetical protein [Nitrososphaerota archaeon]